MIDCRGCGWFGVVELTNNYICRKFDVVTGEIGEGTYVVVPCAQCGGRFWNGSVTFPELRDAEALTNRLASVFKREDAVNHPAHYTKGKIEVIDILESIVSSMDLTPTEAGLTWSVSKYIARWKNKGGVEDLKKSAWYLKRLIEEVEK